MFDFLLSDKEKRDLNRPENRDKKEAFESFKILAWIGVVGLFFSWVFYKVAESGSKHAQLLIRYVPFVPAAGQVNGWILFSAWFAPAVAVPVWVSTIIEEDPLVISENMEGAFQFGAIFFVFALYAVMAVWLNHVFVKYLGG